MENELQSISGTVDAVIYQNEDNGYAVIRLVEEDGEEVTAVGTMPQICLGEELMLTALLDFARRQNGADVIYYLIPCTVDYAGFVWRHRDALEPYYVVADWEEMQRVWYGEEEP